MADQALPVQGGAPEAVVSINAAHAAPAIDRDGRPAGPVRIDRSLIAMLARRVSWLETFVILATIVAASVVLGFLAAYFHDYSHLGLIFFRPG
jgi:hypothetical protein